MRYAVEILELINKYFNEIPFCFYVYSNSVLEIIVGHLPAQKSYIALFLQCNFDGVLVTRTAASLYCTPVAQIHSIADLVLPSTGLMRKPMRIWGRYMQC